MEHAIKNEIHVKLEENPVFYTSLRERLEQLIDDRKAKRIDAAQQLKLFEDLRKELRGHAQAAENARPLRDRLRHLRRPEPKPMKLAEPRGLPTGRSTRRRRSWPRCLEEQLEAQVGIVDWTHKDDVQREMRKLIKRQLRAAGFTPDEAIDADGREHRGPA
jgi:type I restriction enzyme R subunit